MFATPAKVVLGSAKNNKKGTITTIKLTKLKKGKTYYIKVRAFNLDSNKKRVYGKWSNLKALKIKK